MKFRFNQKYLRPLFGFLAINLLIFTLGQQVRPAEIQYLVARAGAWAPLVFTLIMIPTYVVAPISGTPFYAAGFALFGSHVQYYNAVAQVISATLVFGLSRRFGRGLVTRLVGQDNMAQVDEFTQNYGLKALIFFRLLQLQFFDFVSYAYGLTNMRFWPYFWVTVLCQIPWILLWQFVLFPLVDNMGEFVIILFSALAPLWVLTFFYYRFRYRQKANKTTQKDT